MIDLIKSFFTDHLDPESQAGEEQKLKACELASAALMVEMMEADHELDEREHDEFIRVLEKDGIIAGICISFPAMEQRQWPELRTLLLALGMPQRIRFLLLGLPMIMIFVSRKLEDGDQYLSNVCVHRSFRGTGCGRQLMEHAIQSGTQAGAKRLVLDVSVTNQAAQKLYRSLGFQAVNRTGFRYGRLRMGVYRMYYTPT